MKETLRPVPLEKSHRLINHGPVVLVSSASGDRCNVMTAAWVMPLDFSPAKVSLVIDSQAFTRELMEASGEFALSIPCRAMADKVFAAGRMSGRDGDKFAATGLEKMKASLVAAPLIRGCVGWLECRIIPGAEYQKRYDLFVAEVVAAWSDPDVFCDGIWHFPDSQRRTIHYQADGTFFATGEAFALA